MQTSSDGTSNEISGATTPSYVPSVDDIGYFVSVSCEPVRSDWARGPTVLSEKVGPIVPGKCSRHFALSLIIFMQCMRCVLNFSCSFRL